MHRRCKNAVSYPCCWRAVDGAGEVSACVSSVHREFWRRIPSNSSPKPDPVLQHVHRHRLAPVLADVWRTLP